MANRLEPENASLFWCRRRVPDAWPQDDLVRHNFVFSILIPSNERQAQLTARLESLTGFEYPQDLLEVIVVDDESKNFKRLRARFRRELNLILVRQANMDPTSARSRGCDGGNGEFLGLSMMTASPPVNGCGMTDDPTFAYAFNRTVLGTQLPLSLLFILRRSGFNINPSSSIVSDLLVLTSEARGDIECSSEPVPSTADSPPVRTI